MMFSPLRFAAMSAMIGGLSVGARALGAQDSTRADSATAGEVEVSDASPRAMLRHFLSLARAGEYELAAMYLSLPDSLASRGSTLARQLKAVLDRHLWIDLERVSPLAEGNTADGLPPAIEQVGTVQGAGTAPLRVRLARAAPGDSVSWRFSAGTVGAITSAYEALEGRWLLENLPAPLLRPGPFDVLWWQWLALPLVIAAAALTGALASRVLEVVLTRVASRTSTELDDMLLERLRGPFTVGFALLAARAYLPPLSLYPPAADAGYLFLRGALLIVMFWAFWRLVDVVRLLLARTEWAKASASSRALLPLASRVIKVCVLAIAAVAVLSLAGYPVASLVAGLGIGGLALALAAQKTVENLFGAFSIGVDQPFREGDFVRIEDFVGTVEAIGLRSTRFRTLDRTLVTIPNGRVADMRLESYTARDRMRLALVIGLVYGTSVKQMREVLEGLERVLRSHPRIWPDAVVVRFREFAASSLDVEVMAWFQTAEWSEFQAIRQEVLLQFMEVVEGAGTSFAFPTQTIHLEGAMPDERRPGTEPLVRS